jgi:hypothetical protein
MVINYTIHVPASTSIAIGQSYGDVFIPDYSGPVSLNVDYGNIQCKNINNNTKINLDYGAGNFGKLLSSDMDVAYSEIEIESCGTLKLNLDYGQLKSEGTMSSLYVNADYSEIKLGKVSSLTANSDYSHYKITSCGNIKYNNSYGDLEINTLTGNLNVSSDYTNISIMDVSPIVSEIDINGDYASVKINAMDYTYDISGDYMTIKEPAGNKSRQVEEGESNKTYRGKKGKGATKINITGDYSNVTLR